MPRPLSGPIGASLSPNAALSSPPWYKGIVADSDTEDHHHNPEFEFLAGASTPLHVNQNKSIMFASPMRRLGGLHLSPDRLDQHPPAHDRHIDEHRADDLQNDNNDNNDDDDDDDGYGAGNQTIHTNSSSDEDIGDDVDEDESPAHPLNIRPTFIPHRKRKHTESPLEMEITPSGANHTIPHGSSEKMSGILGNETYESILKVSFSASDSTPCPPHPRKKLRFKAPSSSEESTPSQPSKMKKPLLNFSSSRKLAAPEVPLIHKLNDAQDDLDESARSLSGFSGATMNLNSTPISQSTPANSRAPSPCIPYETSEDGVNGFKFVRQSTNFSYRTPQSRPTAIYEDSQRLINAYVADDYSQQKYEIVGEFRASAAGMMEEVEDLHVGDKRINDPYAGASPSSRESDDHLELRHRYMTVSNKLPLLQHFERDLTKQQMKTLINDKKSVVAFYKYIFTNEPKDEGLVFLKKERLRWHPDKWVNKYDHSAFDKEIVDSLSQVINAIIDTF